MSSPSTRPATQTAEPKLPPVAETPRRLFAFLDRLRKSKDQAEFDQFMADRARRTPPVTTDSAA